MEYVIQDTGIDTLINPKRVTVNAIVNRATSTDKIEGMEELEGGEASVREVGKYLTMIPLREGGKSIQSFIKEELGGLMRFLNTFEDRFTLSVQQESNGNQRKETYVKLRQDKSGLLETLSSVSYVGQNAAYPQNRNFNFQSDNSNSLSNTPLFFNRSRIYIVSGNFYPYL